MNHIEFIILHNLQVKEDYARRVMPYLKSEYFDDFGEREYFKAFKTYFEKYQKLPSNDAINLYLQSLKISEDQFNVVAETAQNIQAHKSKDDIDWLIDSTENFCKDKALENALSEAIVISNSSDQSKLSKTAIPELLSKALSVSFDANIGHHYIGNSDQRYDYYHKKVYKIPCHLDMLNRITDGGAERKTVNCIAAGTGIGKSMLLCDLAAGYAKNGYNVLYITNEMAEEKISLRIDSNFMNLDISKIDKLDRDVWDKKIERVKDMCVGNIIIKEYPTSTAHVGHYRFLLKELKQKQGFIPDIIIVDYLNICASSKYSDKANSYGYIKSICEELRGLAVESDTLLWTATQLNRDGIDNSDVDMKNISESMGGPMTFDFLFALISNEELANMGQVMIKQLKNRYGDLFNFNKFTIGVDRSKMKFYDLVNSSTNKALPQSDKTVTRFSGIKK